MGFIIDNRKILRVLTFIPSVLGIIVFTIIVKFVDDDVVDIRLPYYQGLMCFYSLVFMGFTYVTNRREILGKNILIFLILICLIPSAFYFNEKISVIFIFLLSLVFCLYSCVLYLLLLKDELMNYILFSAIVSVILPFTLLLNFIFLFFLILVLAVLFVNFFSIVRPNLANFVFSRNGYDIAKSIFLHCPIVFLPFFDFKIQEIIGISSYGDFVLYNKYINGIITLLFSYSQLTLLFKVELIRDKLMLKILVSIFLIIIILVFVDNNLIFLLLLGLYSLSVNLGSLIMRNKLMSGVKLWQSLLGLIFFILYVVSLNLFAEYIFSNINFLVLFMYLAMILPTFFLSIRLNYRISGLG